MRKTENLYHGALNMGENVHARKPILKQMSPKLTYKFSGFLPIQYTNKISIKLSITFWIWCRGSYQMTLSFIGGMKYYIPNLFHYLWSKPPTLLMWVTAVACNKPGTSILSPSACSQHSFQ